MRTKAYYQAIKKLKTGFLAIAAAAILAVASLPVGSASAKVWQLPEILERKAILDAEAEKVCNAVEAIGDAYWRCYEEQYENFIKLDETNPLRTLDQLTLNQRTKEFAERTITITYVDPVNLEIKVYFNDHNYKESDTIATRNRSRYVLSWLTVRWISKVDASTVISVEQYTDITPNQEVLIKMTDQPDLYRDQLHPQFITEYVINGHTGNTHNNNGNTYLECAIPGTLTPDYIPLEEGMVCLYTNSDDDPRYAPDVTYRGYYPDGTRPSPEPEEVPGPGGPEEGDDDDDDDDDDHGHDDDDDGGGEDGGEDYVTDPESSTKSPLDSEGSGDYSLSKDPTSSSSPATSDPNPDSLLALAPSGASQPNSLTIVQNNQLTVLATTNMPRTPNTGSKSHPESAQRGVDYTANYLITSVVLATLLGIVHLGITKFCIRHS